MFRTGSLDFWLLIIGLWPFPPKLYRRGLLDKDFVSLILLHLRKSLVLRSAIKIKAYTLLLAWTMIFAHSVIPHNHLDECNNNCNRLMHQSTADNQDVDRTLKFKIHPEDIRICHVSGFLFNQFDQDNLFLDSGGNINICPVCLKFNVFFSSGQQFLSGHWNASASFRAPPSA